MNRTLTLAATAALLAAPVLATATGSQASDDPTTALYNVGLTDLGDLEPGDTFHGATVEDTIPQIDVATVETERPVLFRLQAEQDERVEYVERDSHEALSTQFTPDDPQFDQQWGFDPLPGIGAEAAWDTTLGSTGVTVAVLDTGLEKGHEDIGNFEQGKDFVEDDDEPQDENGHGTHVAGTVGALTDNGVGVAGTAQTTILPVRVLDEDGTGSLADAAEGLVWATDNGADVASMSFGCSINVFCDLAQPMEEALDYAVSNDVVPVCAAGNEGPLINSVTYPANDPDCAAVSAVNENGDIALFSSRGPEVELAAPGDDILSTCLGDDYCEKSGTSMAAPHVSGTAALAAAQHGIFGPTLRQHLHDTAVDTDLSDDEEGHGLVNADNAVNNQP